MCELFGFSSSEPVDIVPQLRTFYGHSVDHPDGWGLAVFAGNQMNIEKEPTPAFESIYLDRRLSVPVRETLVLAHIRKASVGSVRYPNCHPFTGADAFGKRWTLIHNGTLFEEPDREKYAAVQTGSTDSERILLRFLEQVNSRKQQPDRSDCAEILGTVLESLSQGNNKINMMLTDGRNLYVYANHAQKLQQLSQPGQMLFATVPLSDALWQPVPELKIQVCTDGQLIHTTGCFGRPYTPPAAV